MSSKSSEAVDGAGFLSTTQIAKLLLINPERVRQLVKDGWIEKEGRSKFSLLKAVHGYIRFLKDADRRSSKNASHARMQDLKAERLEMDMQRDRHELVARSDAEFVVDFIAGLTRRRMMSVAVQYTRDAAERKRLEDLISAALGKIADDTVKKFEALENGGDVSD